MPELTRVVDSWAMVAWIRDESAAGAVEAFLDEAGTGRCGLAMSWINVAETFYILSERNSAAVLPDEMGIMAAARIKAAHAVAFGDAFAIALAQAERASVITGDGEIRKCGVVEVDWVGV